MNHKWRSGSLKSGRATACVLSLSLLAAVSFWLTSCAGVSKLSNLRDVQVSEVTLAEPLIAEAKVLDRVARLRAGQKRQELTGALAELSMVHRKLGHDATANDEANQAIHLLDPLDKSSHEYFLVCRARCFLLNTQGEHGSRVLKPLLAGNWSNLDKAQIYNDLAENWGAPGGLWHAKEYALKSLMLRLNATGPHSLEVAESLTTFMDRIPPDQPIDIIDRVVDRMCVLPLLNSLKTRSCCNFIWGSGYALSCPSPDCSMLISSALPVII